MNSTRVRRVLSAARWPAICWIIVFWRLGYPSLLDPDEAHYAELTREMVRARSWLVPLLDGAPYIDKPVLFHWLQGIFIEVFGESELTLRLPTAIASLALFWITRWAGTKLFDRTAGNWGATMFATIPATFVLSSVGLFDMLFAAFLFGSVSCLIVAARDGRQHLQDAGWILLVLAVMTKGPVALVLMTVFLLVSAMWSAPSRQMVRSLHWPSGLLFVALAAAPWFVWMWGRFGDQFVSDYLFAGNLWYMTLTPESIGRKSDYFFYLRTFSGAFFPWSLVMLGYTVDALVRWRKRQPLPAGESLLWIWILVVVGFFTIAGFKLDTYIFPAAPACCLLAARGWQRAQQEATWHWTRASVVVVAVVLLGGGLVASVFLFQINLGLDWTAVGLPVALGVGGGALLWLLVRQHWRPPDPLSLPLATLLAVYASLVVFGFPVLERTRPTAPIGRWIQDQVSPDFKIAAYGLDEWRASLRYYTNRHIAALPTLDAVEVFLGDSPSTCVVMLRRDYRELRARGLNIKVVQKRPMIAGRSGKFIRRQVWDDLLVVANRSMAIASTEP